MLLRFGLELAVVALLLEELIVMVLAVEPTLVCNVVGRANSAAPMTALEAGFVVRSSINLDLENESIDITHLSAKQIQ